MKILIDYRNRFLDRSGEDGNRLINHCQALLAEMPEIEGFFWNKGWDWQLPKVMRKFKPDILLTTGLLSSPGLTIPQGIWLPAELKEHRISFFYKKRIQNTFLSARIIFTDSEKNKQRLLIHYKQNADKVMVLYPLADENHGLLPAAEKEEVKAKFAAGKEYFVVTPPYPTTGELLHLLKAFSLFKKRLQSNMQLVLAGSDMKLSQEFYKKLETYKHQGDVHVIDQLEKDSIKKIVEAAYAMLYPFDKGSGTGLLNAFQSQVPVIAAEESSLRELSNDAVLYADPMNHDQFANQLNRIYKDEKLRKDLIEKGKFRCEMFSRKNSVMRFWKSLSVVIKN